MTLFDKSRFLVNPHLLAQPASFGGVLAQPERHLLPDGEVLMFRFGNGYGAALTHMAAPSDQPLYEFCVLDCAASGGQPSFETPVASGILSGLDHAAATQALLHTEQLPPHPQVLSADAALLLETF